MALAAAGLGRLGRSGRHALLSVVYAAGHPGRLAALAHLGRLPRQVEAIDELAGLGRTRRATAAALAVCLFSLAGVPPLAGLWGKLWLFGSALAARPAAGSPARPGWWPWRSSASSTRPWGPSTISASSASCTSARRLQLRSLARRPTARSALRRGALRLAVLALGVYPGPLMRVSRAAVPQHRTAPWPVTATAARN